MSYYNDSYAAEVWYDRLRLQLDEEEDRLQAEFEDEDECEEDDLHPLTVEALRAECDTNRDREEAYND